MWAFNAKPYVTMHLSIICEHHIYKNTAILHANQKGTPVSQDNAVVGNTVVWEKFTAGYFRVKIVCDKTFLSLGYPMKNF